MDPNDVGVFGCFATFFVGYRRISFRVTLTRRLDIPWSTSSVQVVLAARYKRRWHESSKYFLRHP